MNLAGKLKNVSKNNLHVCSFLKSMLIIYNYFLIGQCKLLSPFKRTAKGMVSIITPTYNRLQSLKETVQCVRNQAYKNWEHIIVSDGYDPRVKEFVSSLKDARINFFIQCRHFAGDTHKEIMG